MKKIIVWIIQAYQQQTETGGLIDAVVLELIADSEKEAVKRARQLVKKKFYRLSR
jgi:hypothetical protein